MKSLIVVGFCTLLCCRSVLSATHYVDIASTNPVSPYTNWVTAATNIQDAVDVAVNGETVLVSDGYHLLSSEITVTNSITLQSVNGPVATIVDGHAGNRCFNLGASGCLVAGFSITGGFTTERGGGLYCQNITAVVSNCTVDANYSDVAGGGIFNEGILTLNNCILSSNYTYYGGGILNEGTLTLNNCGVSGNVAYNDGGGIENWGTLTLYNCDVSGNAASGIGGGIDNWEGALALTDCKLTGNYAFNYGGGILNEVTLTANNCTLSGNQASFDGGGIENWGTLTLNNCGVIGNVASGYGGGIDNYEGTLTLNNCTLCDNNGGEGGGIYTDATITLNNTISYYNTATSSGDNWKDPGNSMFSYCCTTPDPGGNGNITNAPLFIGTGDYRLAPNSPCINAGSNGYVNVATDLDGNPRIIDDMVDMGAYEAFYVTNSYSSASGCTLEWMSCPTGWNSVVQYSTNLVTMPFTDLTAPMLYPANSYTDTVHAAESLVFYKVEIAP